MQPNPLPDADGAEVARMARPFPVNPSSVGSPPKSVISQSNPKNSSITAKMHSVNPTSATIKPSSERDYCHSRKRSIPRREVRVLGSFAHVDRPPGKSCCRLPVGRFLRFDREKAVGRTKPMSGGRMAKGIKPVVKVLSNPCGVENPHTWKPSPKDILPHILTATVCQATVLQLSSSLCIPHRSCHFEPAAPQEPPVPVITHDPLVPREERGPLYTAHVSEALHGGQQSRVNFFYLMYCSNLIFSDTFDRS